MILHGYRSLQCYGSLTRARRTSSLRSDGFMPSTCSVLWSPLAVSLESFDLSCSQLADESSLSSLSSLNLSYHTRSRKHMMNIKVSVMLAIQVSVALVSLEVLHTSMDSRCLGRAQRQRWGKQEEMETSLNWDYKQQLMLSLFRISVKILRAVYWIDFLNNCCCQAYCF